MSAESDHTDAMCPICTLFLIEPVTLPCCHKELCKQCLDKACAETALTCPFCRVRIAVWVRKTRSLVNEKRWKELQKRYPEEIRRRLEGLDDQVSGNEAGAPRVALAKPGEIHEEYEEEKRKYQREQEEIRQAEEAASRQLIQQLQEEGKALPPEAQLAIEERMRMDEELANRLVKEEQCAMLESRDPPKKNPASPTSASQGKLGPLDSFFEAMKQGSAQKAKRDSGDSSEVWRRSSSPSALESKAPTALAGPGRKAETTLSSARPLSKPSATATISKAPSSESESDNDSDSTVLDDDEVTHANCPDSPVNSGHHGSTDGVSPVVPSVNASVSVAQPEAKTAATSSKTETKPEKVVQSKPLVKPSSVPATSNSEALKAAPSGQVRNGNSVGSGSASTRALLCVVPSRPKIMLPLPTAGRTTVLLPRSSSDHTYTLTVASSTSNSTQTSGSGSPSSSVSTVEIVRSPPTGNSLVKPTSQAQLTQPQKGCHAQTATCICCTNNTSSSGPIQVTASCVQGTTTNSEDGKKVNVSGSSTLGARRHLYLSVQPLGSGSVAGMSEARDKVSTASSNSSGVATAPSSSVTTRPVNSASSPLSTDPHRASTYKRTISDDDASSLQSSICHIDLTEVDDTDMESENAEDDKQELHKERSGDAGKPEAMISNLLGLHGRPTLPESPACSSFHLDQPSAKPGRHPDLDLESSPSGGSATTDDEMDDNSNWSSSAHSTHSTRLTKDQDSLDDFQGPGMTAQASHRRAGGPEVVREKATGSVDQEERGRGKGREEAVSKGKGKGRGKRKGSPRPASATKKQKVDKNQPSLHKFFSRQGSSSSNAGPSVEKSQEEKDMELALELQKQFDIEVKYKLTANRFKGAGNEYSLRETRRKQ